MYKLPPQVIALAHSLPLFTTNRSHFERVENIELVKMAKLPLGVSASEDCEEQGGARRDGWLDESADRVFARRTRCAGVAAGRAGHGLPTESVALLQTIPVGEVRTYGEVAQAIGAPGASRAVGTACGSNKVALVIPCHRVIRGDQGLGGYRWGIERKTALLAAEKKRYAAQRG